MKRLRGIHKDESGAALILPLILLIAGSSLIVPLLNLTHTGVELERFYKTKMHQMYAAEDGIEKTIYEIINGDEESPLAGLEDGESYTETISDLAGHSSVDITTTKLSLLYGILGDKEYQTDKPHEEWMGLQIVGTPNQGAGWVEYECAANFNYDGSGWRDLETVGFFFFPPPSDESLIQGPTLTSPGTPEGEITFNKLESVETKMTGGGFAFIWRWKNNQGPDFKWSDQTVGALSFKFKVYDPTWEPITPTPYVWATIRQQDVSYIANGNISKWLIESEVGDSDSHTKIKAAALVTNGTAIILTWEIDPPD